MIPLLRVAAPTVMVVDKKVVGSPGTSSYVVQRSSGGLVQRCVWSSPSWAWAVCAGFEVSASTATAASITATSNSGASLMPRRDAARLNRPDLPMTVMAEPIKFLRSIDFTSNQPARSERL